MKLRDMKSIDSSDKGSILDFDNFFEIYVDKRGNFAYNLNSNLYFDCSGANLEVYVPTHDLHPTIVSYNIYGTPRLAWLICKVNGVTDPSAVFESGSPVLYVPKDYIGDLARFMG